MALDPQPTDKNNLSLTNNLEGGETVVTAVLFCDHDGFEGSAPSRQPGHGWLPVSAPSCRHLALRGQQIQTPRLASLCRRHTNITTYTVLCLPRQAQATARQR